MKTSSYKARTADVFPLDSLPDDVLALVVDYISCGADKKALRSMCRRLRVLVDATVSRISLHSHAYHDLDKVAALRPALRVLQLPGLPSAAGPALGRATFASLEELRVKKREIEPDAGMDLAASVARMSKLRLLDSRRTNLGDAGVQALAQVECPSLEQINLANNGLGLDAVNAIAEASSK